MMKGHSSHGGNPITRWSYLALAVIIGTVIASLWTGLLILRVEVIINPQQQQQQLPALSSPSMMQQQQQPAALPSGRTGTINNAAALGSSSAGGKLPPPPAAAPEGDAPASSGSQQGGSSPASAAVELSGKDDGGDAPPPPGAPQPKCWRKNVRQAEPPSAAVAANPKCNAGDRARWRPGKCSFDTSWLEPWTRFRPGGNWTLVDVGANKGYVIAGWLDVLEQDSQHSPHHLGMLLFNRTMTGGLDGSWMPSHCGGCCECLDRPPRMAAASKAHSIRAFGFEPSIANYRWLSSFFTNRNTVTIRNAAVSDKTGRAYFPDNPLGIETGKIVSVPTEGYLPVDIVTLDEELEHVDFIDVLSTDAEGFDQAAARGARRFLEDGKVGVYQFEMYAPDDYKSIFERLKSWGYDCYFSTASRRDRCHKPPKKPFFKVPMIVRITDCWEDEYQGYVGWVNGLCHNTRIEALNKIFAYLAHKHHKGGSGNCDSKALQRRKTRDFIRDFVMPLRQGEDSKGRPDEIGAAPARSAPDDDDKHEAGGGAAAAGAGGSGAAGQHGGGSGGDDERGPAVGGVGGGGADSASGAVGGSSAAAVSGGGGGGAANDDDDRPDD